jgi:hypothetical protein
MTANEPLRIGDLLGRDIRTAAGDRIGRAHDARLCRDGPYLPGFGPALRLHALIIGPPSIASRLGLDRPDSTGPWPLHVWGRRALRHARLLLWEDLQIEDDHIISRRPLEQLEPAYPENPA